MLNINVYKDVFKSLKNNIFKYMVIFSISQLAAYFFLKLTSITLLNYALSNAKLSGITNENFLSVLTSPFTILLLLIAVIFLGVLAIFQNIIIFNLSTEANLKEIFKALKRIKLNDVGLIIIYTLLVLPFSNIGLTLYFISNLKIPNFVLGAVLVNNFMIFIYYALLVLVLYINLRLYYTFIIFYKKDVSFKEAMLISIKITKNKSLQIIIFNVIISLYALLITGIIALLYIVFNYLAKSVSNFEIIIAAFGSSLIIVLALLSYVLSSIYYIQFTIISYDKDLVKVHEEKYNYLSLLIPLAVIALSIYGFIVYTPLDSLREVKIISHRGDITNAVENTVEALLSANDLGVDYVEIDVQQLKDNTLVVYHDPSLKRLSKHNIKIEDANWDDIKDLLLIDGNNIGKISKLEDYLLLAKELDQKILLEIKVNDKDNEDFVSSIIELVKSLDMNDYVAYQSLNKEAILKVKAIDEKLYTAYIIGFNLGGLENINVDAYSIDETSVTKKVVLDSILLNKDLLIWSVDTNEVIERAFSKKPAGIITDSVNEVKAVREDLILEPMSRMLWQIEF